MVIMATKEELGIVQTATASVRINVRRNQNPPIFTQDVYSGTLSEKDPLPVNPLQIPVLATDADGVSIKSTFS